MKVTPQINCKNDRTDHYHYNDKNRVLHRFQKVLIIHQFYKVAESHKTLLICNSTHAVQGHTEDIDRRNKYKDRCQNSSRRQTNEYKSSLRFLPVHRFPPPYCCLLKTVSYHNSPLHVSRISLSYFSNASAHFSQVSTNCFCHSSTVISPFSLAL